jgi:hypothetical protein
MIAEEEWANRMEHDADRGEIEIKFDEDLSPDDGSVCFWSKCNARAIRSYVVGKSGRPNSDQEFMLCEDHATDDNALEMYEIG